jgi:hypothetical protein
MYLINFEKKNSIDTLIRMKVDDLNESLIDFLRNSFKGGSIEVHILEEDPEMDETEFLLRDPTARKEIMESIEEVNKDVGLKKYNTVEELKQEFLNEPNP